MIEVNKFTSPNNILPDDTNQIENETTYELLHEIGP